MREGSRRPVGPFRFAAGALLRIVGAALMVATGVAVLVVLGVLAYYTVAEAIASSVGHAVGYAFLLVMAGGLGAPVAFAVGGGIAGWFLSLASQLLAEDSDGVLGFAGLFDDGGLLDLGDLGGFSDGGDGGGGDGG